MATNVRSTATPAPPRVTRLPLSTAIASTLEVLSGRGAPGRLLMKGRAALNCVDEFYVDALWDRRGRIPARLLGLLEQGDWTVKVGLAVHGSGLSLLRLSALAASWSVPRIYVNPADSESPYGRRWLPDGRGLLAAAAKASTAPWGRPSIILDATTSVVAIWRLEVPVDVSRPPADARAMLMLRALAALLGADVPAPTAVLADVQVPIPGTRVREGDRSTTVHLVELELGRAYPKVEDIERHIEAGAAGKEKKS